MSSSDRVVSNKVLFELVRSGSETSKRVQSINGTFGEQVKNAVETKHLHAGAFGTINRLHKMDEAKRNDFLASFGLYIDKMREGPWKEGHVGDFVAQAEASEREEERQRQMAARDQEVDDSVARIEHGIKGVPDPANPDKVTTIADARKKKAEREATKVERGAARSKRQPRSKDDVKAAAERAFKASGQDEAAPDEGEAEDAADEQQRLAHEEGQRRVDEAGNTLPPDLESENVDWDASARNVIRSTPEGDDPVGMPGAEGPGAFH